MLHQRSPKDPAFPFALPCSPPFGLLAPQHRPSGCRARLYTSFTHACSLLLPLCALRRWPKTQKMYEIQPPRIEGTYVASSTANKRQVTLLWWGDCLVWCLFCFCFCFLTGIETLPALSFAPPPFAPLVWVLLQFPVHPFCLSVCFPFLSLRPALYIHVVFISSPTNA